MTRVDRACIVVLFVLAWAAFGNVSLGRADVGMELDYAQTTTNVAVTATADGNGGGTAVFDGAAHTYDGTTRIEIEVSGNASIGATTELVLNLYDGTTDLGRLIQVGNPTASSTDFTLHGARFLTPASGSHTYHVRAWKAGSGTVFIYGGVGGASTVLPSWYRVTDQSTAAAGGGSSTLAGLTDVAISSPTNGQALKYDTASSKWTNQTDATGSGGGGGPTELSTDDRNRLDLIWWGVWLLIGVTLAGSIAHEWHRTWEWFRLPFNKATK